MAPSASVSLPAHNPGLSAPAPLGSINSAIHGPNQFRPNLGSPHLACRTTSVTSLKQLPQSPGALGHDASVAAVQRLLARRARVTILDDPVPVFMQRQSSSGPQSKKLFVPTLFGPTAVHARREDGLAATRPSAGVILAPRPTAATSRPTRQRRVVESAQTGPSVKRVTFTDGTEWDVRTTRSCTGRVHEWTEVRG